MAKSSDILIAEIRARVHSLLYDEVIQHTIVVMRELGTSLSQLAGQVRGSPDALTDAQKEQLREILLPLNSESIREALHKGELPITNGIIRSKNSILTAIGVPIPEGHAEIDPRNYPNYNW
jgi:hypothetical protein